VLLPAVIVIRGKRGFRHGGAAARRAASWRGGGVRSFRRGPSGCIRSSRQAGKENDRATGPTKVSAERTITIQDKAFMPFITLNAPLPVRHAAWASQSN